MRALTVCICLCFCLVGADLSAQGLSLESVDNLYNTDTLPVNQEVTFNIRVSNPTATQYGGITNGFRIFSPDGAEWTKSVPDTFSFGWPDMFPLIYAVLAFSDDGMASDTCAFGGARLATGGLTPGFDEVAYKITIGPIDASYHQKTICLDSTWYPTSGTWKWASPNYFPTWSGMTCYKIFDPNAPVESNMIISTNTLSFSVVQDDPPPAVQMFDVTSDNAPLPLSISEDASWIIANPITGTTPLTVNVQINNIGLGVGTYLDSIEISSGGAVLNSPQWVQVSLEVLPKPPEIAFTPTEFFFNAIATGSNPADKILTITNAGGEPLNWSLSNNTSWLSTTPSSGIDSVDVALSVDITGLVFGDYDDTIVITDANSINSPQLVPVHLTIASDLPLIALDSSSYHVVSTPNNASPDPKLVTVLNGGAGLMNFDITESSSYIDSIVPSTGTAPQQVTVYFDLTGTTFGQTIFDTMWVNSNEAINSPQPVEFEYHIVSLPAEIHLNKDTAHLVVTECNFGLGAKPTDLFTVSNTPGADQLDYSISFESNLFTLKIVEGVNWDEVTLTARVADLPLGIYYDTIMISAPYAINSPQFIYVAYDVRESTLTPQIFISDNTITFTTQENEGPIYPSELLIFNANPGCMEWTIDEDATWLTPSALSGNVPAGPKLAVDATGISFGDHQDTLYVEALTASNTPFPVRLYLRVWRLHGDYDYDGILTIHDILLMVDQFFDSGPGPIPEWRVGDLNCDQTVDVSDLLYFVDYAFDNGPIPCGNPY